MTASRRCATPPALGGGSRHSSCQHKPAPLPEFTCTVCLAQRAQHASRSSDPDFGPDFGALCRNCQACLVHWESRCKSEGLQADGSKQNIQGL